MSCGSVPRKEEVGKGKTVGITPDPDLLEWLRARVGPSGRWSGYTHFFNWAVAQAKAEEEALEEALASSRKDALRDFLHRR